MGNERVMNWIGLGFWDLELRYQTTQKAPRPICFTDTRLERAGYSKK